MQLKLEKIPMRSKKHKMISLTHQGMSWVPPFHKGNVPRADSTYAPGQGALAERCI